MGFNEVMDSMINGDMSDLDKSAKIKYDILESLIKAGFKREEAMQILLLEISRVPIMDDDWMDEFLDELEEGEFF